jgi:CheY-like chemotaxis protein
VLADDEEVLRRLLQRLLGLLPDVEIVGEAANGSEAVELVQRLTPEIVLLDCDMPRVDGPSAAELILSRFPQTRILLHSGGATEQKQAQAAALGLTIFDKSLLHDTVRLIETIAAEMRPTLEPLVLLAMADRGGDGVLIVAADGTIPFYNGIAASVLHLPLPAQRLSLSTLGERVRVVDEHGLPHGIEELPLSRALSARVATRASVTCEYIADGSQARFEMASLPFFSPGGEFIGVGNYLSAALN